MVDEVIGSLDWDASAAEETTTEVLEEAEKALEKVREVKEEQETSFNEVLGMMRASYMMVTGLSQALGGSLPQIFSSIFSVAISTIATYKAIATAMMASGVGAVQAGIMFASLVVAIRSLVATMTQQPELAKRMSGLNTALHGISMSISTWSI